VRSHCPSKHSRSYQKRDATVAHQVNWEIIKIRRASKSNCEVVDAVADESDSPYTGRIIIHLAGGLRLSVVVVSHTTALQSDGVQRKLPLHGVGGWR
jgi:hypothetical protein